MDWVEDLSNYSNEAVNRARIGAGRDKGPCPMLAMILKTKLFGQKAYAKLGADFGIC